MRGRQAVAVAWRRASRLRAAAALVSDSGTQDQKTSVDLRAVHLAGVGAETPEVPLGVGGREAPGAVVLVAEASDDGGADGHGSVVEGVGLVGHHVDADRAKGKGEVKGVTPLGVAEHYPAAARPPDLGVDDAFAVLTGDGELLLEAEGRHQEVDQGSRVSTTNGGPHHRGVLVGTGHREILRRSVGWALG